MNLYTLSEQWTALGRRCIPLRGKLPTTANGFLDASADPLVVKDMLVNAGDADYLGVVPGPEYIVIDCDVKGGRDGVALADELGLNSTFKYRTESGGEHRWFRLPPGRLVGNAVPPEWAGAIDIRSVSGYVRVTAPPWTDPAQVRDFPLLDKLSPPGGGRGGTWGRYVPAKHDELLHPDTVAAHRVLVERYGVDGLHTTIHREKGRDEPWLHVKRPDKPTTGQSASLGYLGAATLHVFSTGWDAFPAGAHDVPLSDEDAVDDAWDHGGVTAVQLDAKRLAPLRYLVPELLTVGGITMLGGPPKSGKSMLALAIACAVAQGGTALGKLPVSHGGAVLYISLDDRSERRAQERLRMVAAGGPMPANLVMRLDDGLGRGTAAVNRLIGYLDRHPDVVLIVIDTVEHVRPDRAGAGESAYTADVRFLAEVRRIVAAHPHVSLLCLAHTRKGGPGGEEDAISAISGTHGVTGGADAVLRLAGKHGAAKRVLDVVSRDARFVQRVVAYHDAYGWQLTDDDPDDPTVQMTDENARLYRAVAAYEEGATAADLRPECEDLDDIPQRLVRMTQRGYLRRLNRGRYVVEWRARTY